MYVDKIDKNVTALEAKLIEENTSRNNLENESIKIKRYNTKSHSYLV